MTAFTKGSASSLPAITTSFDNLFLAGDFVAQGPGTHGAKGLSQEKAYAAGLQAGNLVDLSHTEALLARWLASIEAGAKL